jgi:hypothetical protein
MDAKGEKLALFRYGLIAPLVLEPLARGELTRRAQEIASRQYEIPDSNRHAVSVEPLLRRTLSLQMHEPLRQRIAVQFHLEGLSSEELDAYLAHQLKAAGVTQPLFDDTARQALFQATKGILRKVNKLAMTALRLAAARKASIVGEAILLDATTEALL